jgi:serine/threonine protein kinase
VRLEVAQADNICLVVQRAFVDGRYVVERLLGSEDMAQVYLTYDEVLDRHVALKVLRDQYADDEEFTQRFRHEARSVASLSHPNIVSVYDQGRSEDGAHYIALEYVSGGTLKEHIRREGHLEPAASVGVVLQIANALSEAHDKGVIHRDIKPQNVLVTDKGDVKVTGLGIARAAESVSSNPTATGAVLGTAAYMSPEQAGGNPWVTEATCTHWESSSTRCSPEHDLLLSYGRSLPPLTRSKRCFEEETREAHEKRSTASLTAQRLTSGNG